MASGACSYGQIDPSEWHEPEWIDQEKAAAARKAAEEAKIIYGVSHEQLGRVQYDGLVLTSFHSAGL